MGDEFVVAMCRDIEDPTFDATGWATNPRLRMRPVHRPPRAPADRHPHCAWEATIDEAHEPTPRPTPLDRMEATQAARLPLPEIPATPGEPDGMVDYSTPLDPDLRTRDFATPVLRAFDEEVRLQGHLLSMSFMAAVDDRFGTEAAIDALDRQFVGVAAVEAERLTRAFDLGTDAEDVATVFTLHPAFGPVAYVDWEVAVDGEVVRLALGACPARDEVGVTSWIGLLADGRDRALSAVAASVDPHWSVHPDGAGQWVVERSDQPAEMPAEAALVRISTGADFAFER